MPERKIWTVEQDRILKLLIEERGETKWAQISLIMEQEFNILGRNGKQCRERYHNHLDKNINSAELTRQQENILFDLQDQVGNKWALISGKLAGRTDNSLKNHFYSKLRKSIRKINKRIHKYMKRQYRDIKINTLYKIIETMQKGNKMTQSIDATMYELSRKIKRNLRKYQDDAEQFKNIEQELIFVRMIVQDIAIFDKEIKKTNKKLNHKASLQYEEETPEKQLIRMESSKSVYDDQSQSYNSQLLSSSSISINYANTVASHHIGQPSSKAKSQSNQSDREQNDDQRDFKYRSANSICWKRSQLVGSEQKVKLENNTNRRSQSSDRSEKSSSSKGCRQECFNINSMQIWGQGNMNVISPKRPTIQERIQMQDQRDQTFNDMDLEQHQLIHNFSNFGISFSMIPPKLRETDFD